MVYTLAHASQSNDQGAHVAKGKGPKLNVMRTAASMRAEYRKWLIRLAVGVVACLVAIFAYYVLVANYVIEDQPGLTWILAAIAAIFLGWFGNKFSKTNHAYQVFIEQHGLTTEDVKEFLRSEE